MPAATNEEAPMSQARKTFFAVTFALLLAHASGAAAAVIPQRSSDLITLYCTNGISGSCSQPGDDTRRTIACSHQVMPDGSLATFVAVPTGRKLLVTEVEVSTVTDANTDQHIGVYVSPPSTPYAGHPLLTVPVRSDDQGGNVGVASGSKGWQPGVAIGAGLRPCIADVKGSLISKNPAGSSAHGFVYILIHGYLTR
jgi:hypothetical protein